MAKDSAFRSAVRLARDGAVERVERSLYGRAVGFERTEEQVTVHKYKDAKGQTRWKTHRASVRKFYAPDVQAAQFYLKNRAKDQWRDQWFIQDDRPRSPIDGLGTVAVLDRIEQLRLAILERQANQGVTLEQISDSEARSEGNKTDGD